MISPQKSINPVLSCMQGIIPDQNRAVWKRTTQVSDLGHSRAGKGECVATTQFIARLFNTAKDYKFCARCVSVCVAASITYFLNGKKFVFKVF